MRAQYLPVLAALGALALTTPALAQFGQPSLADSFRLGSGGGVLCQVQSKTRDPAIRTIFDRSWVIVCRDAARPVGKLYQLRGTQEDVLARLATARAGEVSCAKPPVAAPRDDVTTVSAPCRLRDAAVAYTVMTRVSGNTIWVAEGLTGYDSALDLGLQTVVEDRIVPGQVTVATSAIDDPAAFARVQAGTLDPDQALAEGYRRNNSGAYAEASEFFDTLQQRASGNDSQPERQGEYLVNRALQKSNLGEFAEADALFAEARKVPTVDRVQTRLRRNFEAIHLLNQQRYAEALAGIDQPVTPIGTPAKMPGSAIEIGAQVAAEINSGLPVGQRLGASEASALTPEERSVFLDAQALQLRGIVLRLTGKPMEAQSTLDKAYSDVIAVREGRVVSVIRLRGQILAEIGLALEDQKNIAGAEAKMRESLALLELRYPQTVALNGARARLAGFLARSGKTAEAMTEYRTVVQAAAENRSNTTGLGNLLSPYFALLTAQIPANPALVEDMFLASQTLVRPGVADTQAILSRELSEGTGESARLFRQSRNLERDIERSRIDLANLLAAPNRTPPIEAAIVAVTRDIESLQSQQTVTQASLAQFPQFRAIATNAITLAELKQSLKPGEAYFKLTSVGRSNYAVYVDETGATGYRVPLSADELDAVVDGLRDTISKNEGGQLNTYPFNVKLAHKLYTDMLGPVAPRLASVKHLIFEPDGAMLKLPLNLLVVDQASVDGYQARAGKSDADEFDFRGVKWLGRGRGISTAVSARAFRDARNTPASTGARQYIGFGQNAPVSNAVRVAANRSLSGGALNCIWPASEWNKPISAAELRTAQAVVGAGRAIIVTGEAFSDTAVIARSDLADYRILHFATHGLVTAPRPECPARPALLTSFGEGGSDGLLNFREIYDLKINADLVILSACDTAGTATVAATREAGVTSGGGSALDGLVRAFIGAGGRSVLASHWPAPDDFAATERLISGLFQSNGGSIGDSLERAQQTLMDQAETSHPYYWSGFAIIGDGAQTLLTAR